MRKRREERQRAERGSSKAVMQCSAGCSSSVCSI